MFRTRRPILRIAAVAVLGLVVFSGLAAGAGAPGSSGAGGGTPGSSSGGGPGGSSGTGAPSTPPGFACQTCTNFVKPSAGWANWYRDVPPPMLDLEGDHYLCFVVSSTNSPTAPLQLINVPELDGKKIPCFATRGAKGLLSSPARPLLHGDRFRIVLDVAKGDDRAKQFLDNVSVIDLDVTLTIAPPLQPTLLRFNLGGATTAQGLGSASAPEPGEYEDFRRCYEYFSDLKKNPAPPHLSDEETSCANLYSKEGIPTKVVASPAKDDKSDKAAVQRRTNAVTETRNNLAAPNVDTSHPIIILSWPYTLPGDVVPTIYASFLYNNPANGGAWLGDHYYAAGSVVQCPTGAPPSKALCVAMNNGFTGNAPPTWQAAPNPKTGDPAPPTVYTADGQVVWTPLISSSNAVATTDVVANAVGFEWQQTHAPALWGLSTGVVMTTSRIPSSLSFGQAITGQCSDANGGTRCPPSVISTSQKAADIALLISPYIFHHLWSLYDKDAPNGIDVESHWTGLNVEDYLPEPVAGFSLNSVGNAYYVGISEELFIRNLQFVGGRAWIKGATLNYPISGSSSSPTAYTTPSTSMAFRPTWFVGIAYNISGLVSGH
jgi:hypothetical protein